MLVSAKSKWPLVAAASSVLLLAGCSSHAGAKKPTVYKMPCPTCHNVSSGAPESSIHVEHH